jgi:hypothetical protein
MKAVCGDWKLVTCQMRPVILPPTEAMALLILAILRSRPMALFGRQ